MHKYSSVSTVWCYWPFSLNPVWGWTIVHWLCFCPTTVAVQMKIVQSNQTATYSLLLLWVLAQKHKKWFRKNSTFLLEFGCIFTAIHYSVERESGLKFIHIIQTELRVWISFATLQLHLLMVRIKSLNYELISDVRETLNFSLRQWEILVLWKRMTWNFKKGGVVFSWITSFENYKVMNFWIIYQINYFLFFFFREMTQKRK